MRRHRVRWGHMLCVWVYLPRAEPILLSMRTWHFSDGRANDNNAFSSDDNHNGDGDQHDETPVGRMQVFLRAEFRQLVVQMFVGLLYRVLTMCSNYDDFHDSTAAGLQVLVCRLCKTLDEKVQLGQ